MREITRHTPGKIFLAVLAISVVLSILVLPFVFESNAVFMGWLTVPVIAGFILLAVWLFAALVYLNFFWPYR